MYFIALYIGLGTLVLTHLYFNVVPYYAEQVLQGAEANEGLWWQSVQQASFGPLTREQVLSALLLGLFWACAYRWAQQLPTAFLFSVHDLFIWIGLLLLLARIDQACLLLPDVLTQWLLWWGLVHLSLQAPEALPAVLLTMSVIYIGGRLLQFFGNLCFAMPLVGLGDVKLLVAVTPWLGAQAPFYIFCIASALCFMVEAYKQRCWRPVGSCAFGPYLVGASWLVWWLVPFHNS